MQKVNHPFKLQTVWKNQCDGISETYFDLNCESNPEQLYRAISH